MSRSLFIALLVVLILFSGLPLVMIDGGFHCAACPESDVVMLLWGCLAVVVATAAVVARSGLRIVTRRSAAQHDSLIIDRLDRPPHLA